MGPALGEDIGEMGTNMGDMGDDWIRTIYIDTNS